MVRLEQVYKSYGSGQEVLRGISLSLKPGSFYFLAGPSGAGKSTLMSLIALTQKPTRGRITMFDHDVTQLAREDLPFVRRRIGSVHQDFRLLDHLTVEENVALPLKVAGESREQITEKVQELLEWVGLGDYREARPEILSGGQKQRVAIARAVVSKPDILLADEPTGNLDPQLALKVMYLFEGLVSMGTTILIATHDEHLISLFKHPVLRLKDGLLTGEEREEAEEAKEKRRVEQWVKVLEM